MGVSFIKTITVAPADAAPENGLRRFLGARATPLWAYAALYGGLVLAYLFQALVPAFNEDDVNQVQDDGPAALLLQGRWGYAFVYTRLLANNPAPVASSIVGLALLLWAGLWQARLIGLKTNGARLAFILIASISIHYQYLFSFDSTRLAYPLANLLMAGGLYASILHDNLRIRLSGGVLMALATSLYPAALMYGATTVLIGIIAWSLDTRGGPRLALRRAGLALLATLGALSIFALATDVIYALGDWRLGDRVSLSLSGIFSRGDVIWGLFSAFSIPFLTGDFEKYFPPIYYLLVIGLVVSSLLLLFRSNGPTAPAQSRTGSMALSGAAAALLTISPFCLAFITMTSYYPARSLYAYATAYAGLAALAGDYVLMKLGAPGGLRRLDVWLGKALALFAVAFVTFNTILISQRSYDEYLAWQTDRALVERIIGRIDDVIADDAPDLFAPSRESAAPQPIPLAVFGLQHWKSGPRGQIPTARLFPWSRERVFQLIDQRFRTASEEQRASVRPGVQDRRPWPAREAVYLDQGIMVVVLSDERLDW